jgi:hypothetical protein
MKLPGELFGLCQDEAEFPWASSGRHAELSGRLVFDLQPSGVIARYYRSDLT